MIDEYRRLRRDPNYPEILIYSLSFGKFSRQMSEKKFSEAAEYISEALKTLEKAGCSLALISANTPHMLWDRFSSSVKIPILHIVDVLAESLKKDRVKNVGILGTYTTMMSSFYAARLKAHGLRVIVPNEQDARVVHEVIMKELTEGLVKEDSRKALEKVAERLVNKGAEAITLSCTELPLLFPDKRIAGVKAYDTAELHARKAMRISLKMEVFPKSPEERESFYDSNPFIK